MKSAKPKPIILRVEQLSFNHHIHMQQ